MILVVLNATAVINIITTHIIVLLCAVVCAVQVVTFVSASLHLFVVVCVCILYVCIANKMNLLRFSTRPSSIVVIAAGNFLNLAECQSILMKMYNDNEDDVDDAGNGITLEFSSSDVFSSLCCLFAVFFFFKLKVCRCSLCVRLYYVRVYGGRVVWLCCTVAQ